MQETERSQPSSSARVVVTSCLKSPYNALQTLKHWVRHVCLLIVSLGLHESFVDILSGQKVLEIFFFTDFMHCVLFWIKFLLGFYHVVFNWLLKIFFNFGPLTLDSLRHILEPIMGSCHIIKRNCWSFLYLPNKALFRNRPIMHNVHCDMLLALHVCTLESTLVRSPSPGACNPY